MTDLREQLQSALGTTYTLDRELGGGGMSRVFVADEVALDRQVVIKVIAAELLEGVSTERFAREVKLAARLQHANIVPLHSAGVAAGLPFYTMPFVRGETLRARLSRGPLPLTEAVGILRDIARALAYAHGQGVVHRDIKPENVLLSGGAAMVADFGIAKAMSDARTQGDGASMMLTQAGNSLGTPAYMAPEQAAGDPRTDHRADVYAWGVIAYELLVGAHPFAEATSVHAMIAAHMTQTPAPVDTRRTDVPQALADVVTRSLEKDAARRPLRAEALLEALDAQTTPSSARASTERHVEPPQRAPRARRARRVLFLAPALVVLAVAAWAVTRQRAGIPDAPSTATATAVSDSTAPVRSLVVLPFESVGGDTANAYFAEGMADELSNALTKVPGLQLAGRSSAAAFRGKNASPQEIGTALKVGAVLEGTVRRAGGKLRVSTQLTNTGSGLVMWSETFDRDAKDVFAVQDDITKSIVGALRVTLAVGTGNAPTATRGTDDLEAYDLYQRGMYFYQRRGPGVTRALDYMQQAVARDPQFVDAQAMLGLIWLQLGIYTNTPMRDALPQARAASERAVRLDSSSANAWTALGAARTYQYQWRAAEDALRRALRLNPRSMLAHFYLSRLLLTTGRVDDAAAEIQQATTLDPVNFPNLIVSALTLSIAGRHDEAIAAGDRAWEADSTSTAAQQLGAIALLRGGRTSDARRRADVTLRLARDTVDAAASAYVIGVAGDTARAADMARALSRRTTDHPRLNYSLARAWLGAGNSAEALSALERAVSRQEPIVALVPFSDASYDPLRASPRFAALVRKLGLDVALFTSPNGGRPQ